MKCNYETKDLRLNIKPAFIGDFLDQVVNTRSETLYPLYVVSPLLQRPFTTLYDCEPWETV